MADKMTLKAKARILRERRTLEATRKNMMGASGKLGTIARWLGHPIIRQGTGLVDTTYLLDPYEVEEGMPTANDDFIQEEGYAFDGLNRGLHFEIRYLAGINQLTAYYKGYLVYEEKLGDLYAYAPFKEWEDEIVEPLYKQAKKKAEAVGEEIEEAKKLTMIEKGKIFLHELRMRWGV